MTRHVPLFGSRRQFLTAAGGGFGALAFASMLQGADGKPALGNLKPHHAAKAKAVIFLFMEGGPSHVDLFDPKPELTKQHGNPLPPSFGTVTHQRYPRRRMRSRRAPTVGMPARMRRSATGWSNQADTGSAGTGSVTSSRSIQTRAASWRSISRWRWRPLLSLASGKASR